MNRIEIGKKKTRIEWLDSARGICMILMITCHSFGSRRWGPFNGITGYFFLVFFFLCSGLCFDASTPYRDYVKKLFRKLMIPYMLFSLVHLCYNALRSHMWTNGILKMVIRILLTIIYSGSNEFTVFGYQTMCAGPTWFFTCLFLTLVIYKALYRVRWKGAIIVFLAVAASISQNYIRMPFSAQSACIGCMFVWIGDAFREKWFALSRYGEKTGICKLIIVILGLWLALAVGLNLSIVCLRIPFALDLGSNVYNISSLPFSLMGFCIVVLCGVLAVRTQIVQDFLSFYGKNSFQMLLLHSIDITMLRQFNSSNMSFLFATIMLYPSAFIVGKRAISFVKSQIAGKRSDY